MKLLFPAYRLLLAAVCLLTALPSARAGTNNVVINEIMYHPPGENEDLQYVELFNRSAQAVKLDGWKFIKGVKYGFQPGTVIPPQGFLVVARDKQALMRRYVGLTNVIGNFEGKLSHSADHLELANPAGVVVESVKYSDGKGWPESPDGYSTSLERVSPFSDETGTANWAPSKLPTNVRPMGTPGRQNDRFATNPPPAIANVTWSPRQPSPRQPVKVEVTVSDETAIASVDLGWWKVAGAIAAPETAVSFKRIAGDARKGTYQAEIPPQPQASLVRFRITAKSESGAVQVRPDPYDMAGAYSYFSATNGNKGQIGMAYTIRTGKQDNRPVYRFGGPQTPPPEMARGYNAFVYFPTNNGPIELHDYIRTNPRKGGFRVRFRHSDPFKGMTVVSIISEGLPRWILSEPLSYELYKLAGIPACNWEHIKINADGHLMPYQLLIEQPNKAYLKRNGRDDTGNMYKLLWFNPDVVSKHQKRITKTGGHGDLIKVLEALKRTKGNEQWKIIETNFNVQEFVNYYAVNMCIQNWDGFFNNYFLYHDVHGTGKWEIYPWDEDKTWGDYDGASSSYEWYTMPLNYGSAGSTSSMADMARFGGGPFGGSSWWRPPGYFSGPLLSNPEFRKRFLIRLKQICETVFTEERFMPIINSMEARLTGEGESGSFRSDMKSFKNQLINRRKFLLSEIAKELGN